MYTENELYVERIKFDTSFMEENLTKVRHLFEVAVLPELLGRWFSRPPEHISMNDSVSLLLSQADACASTSCTSADDVHTTDKYCYCQQEEHGDMVGCDNDSCPYQWFHLECLKLKTFPKSLTWYCPDCRKLYQKKSYS